MNKRQLANERAAAHGKVRKHKNAYTPRQRTPAELDELQAQLLATAQRNLAKRRR